MSVFPSSGRARALVLSVGSATVLVSGVLTALHAQSQASAHRTTVSPAAIAPLIETQNAFAAVAAQVTPAVVSIHIEGARPTSRFSRSRTSRSICRPRASTIRCAAGARALSEPFFPSNVAGDSW